MEEDFSESNKNKIPINEENIVRDFLSQQIKYFTELEEKIENGDNFPTIKIKVKEFQLLKPNDNEFLLKQLKNEPSIFIKTFEKVLRENLRVDIKKKIESTESNFEDIHIIPDIEDLNPIIAMIQNTNKSMKKHYNKLCRYSVKYASTKFQRITFGEVLYFRCIACDAVIQVSQYRNLRGKYRTPSWCINPRCKARAKSDFILIPDKTEVTEVGYFEVVDINSFENSIPCYVFKNFDYYENITKELNVNEEIEILGIHRLDHSDIDMNEKDQDILDYIEVIDLVPVKIKEINDDLVKFIYEQFKKDLSYFEKIIDLIQPFTSHIYEYFIEKFIFFLNWVSSDSWDIQNGVKDRNSINFIIGGHGGTYKTSLVNRFIEILGVNKFGFTSAQHTTEKGLVPTVQRSEGRGKTLVERVGMLCWYNKNPLIFDEGQYFKEEHWSTLKFVEDGFVRRSADGKPIEAPCKGSIGVLMNYNKNEYECYDYNKKIHDNIGVKERSALDRFDLHYAIPMISDTIHQIIINVRLGAKSVEKNIVRENLQIPDNIDINEFFYNYLMEAKKVYKEVTLPANILQTLTKIDETLSKTKAGGVSIKNIRVVKILQKLLRGISALRLKLIVDDSDIEILRKHLIHTIIPYQYYFYEDREGMNEVRIIDMNDIFMRTFKLLTEYHKIFSASQHINFIREFLRNHYFPRNDTDGVPIMGREVDEKMPDDTGLGKNRKYRDLIENDSIKEFIDKIGYELKIINKATHFVAKILKLESESNQTSVLNKDENSDDKKMKKFTSGDLANLLDHYTKDYTEIKVIQKAFTRIKELFETNNYMALEFNGIEQLLNLEGISKATIQKIIDILCETEILIKDKDNKCKITKNWI